MHFSPMMLPLTGEADRLHTAPSTATPSLQLARCRYAPFPPGVTQVVSDLKSIRTSQEEATFHKSRRTLPQPSTVLRHCSEEACTHLSDDPRVAEEAFKNGALSHFRDHTKVMPAGRPTRLASNGHPLHPIRLMVPSVAITGTVEDFAKSLGDNISYYIAASAANGTPSAQTVGTVRHLTALTIGQHPDMQKAMGDENESSPWSHFRKQIGYSDARDIPKLISALHSRATDGQAVVQAPCCDLVSESVPVEIVTTPGMVTEQASSLAFALAAEMDKADQRAKDHPEWRETCDEYVKRYRKALSSGNTAQAPRSTSAPTVGDLSSRAANRQTVNETLAERYESRTHGLSPAEGDRAWSETDLTGSLVHDISQVRAGPLPEQQPSGRLEPDTLVDLSGISVASWRPEGVRTVQDLLPCGIEVYELQRSLARRDDSFHTHVPSSEDFRDEEQQVAHASTTMASGITLTDVFSTSLPSSTAAQSVATTRV
ncbi:hypothetical protein I317_01449 [Kwoniella heveanensis CBS 569]|nr:hypothetical protein I317_01449 [Kwoniella heveanensis CBS 569]